MIDFKKFANGIDEDGKNELLAFQQYADNYMIIKDEKDIMERTELYMGRTLYKTVENAIFEVNNIMDNKVACEAAKYSEEERVVEATRFVAKYFQLNATDAFLTVAESYGKSMKEKEEAKAKFEKAQEFKNFITYTRNGGEKLNVYSVRRYIEQNTQMLIVRSGAKEPDLYQWVNGVYVKCDDAAMRSIVRQTLEKADTPHLFDTKSSTEIMRQICSKGMDDEGVVLERDLNSDEDIINFKNGMLRLSTMQLEKHDPKIASTIQINANWAESDASTPVFDGYLDTLTRGDDELKTMLLEYMGGCISNRDCRTFKKFLLMVGEGDSGKSVLLSTVINLLGERNVGVSSFEDMSKQFGMAAFEGKRLVCNPDMSYLRTADMSKLKQITGRDMVAVEKKFKDSSNLNFRGLMWFVANELPKFGSDAEGQYMYDRFLVVHCDNVIPENQRDRRLLEKIMKESDGIARKAIKAFKAACERGDRFTEPECVLSSRKKYMAQNSDVVSFMETMMIHVDEKISSIVTKQRLQEFSFRDIYTAYTHWYQVEYGETRYCKGQKDFKQAIAQYLQVPVDKVCARWSGGMYIANWYPNWIAWRDYNLCNVSIASSIAPMMFGVDSDGNAVVSNVSESVSEFRRRIEMLNGMLYQAGRSAMQEEA